MSSERQLLESESRWWGEHVHRYKEALQLINKSDTVLDIACGTGFGTDLLAAHTGGKVIGGDIALDAIEECNRNWKKENMEFKVMDGTKLPFPDEYFDAITSFETIEHTTKYREMLQEFFRVLKKGGRLILSTPNAAITSPDGKIGNPFHTQEFRYRELKKILEDVFGNIAISGQHYSRYDKRSLRMNLGKMTETLLLSFGIRKLPYGFRNAIMKAFFGYSLYPKADDFKLERSEAEIEKKCPVLFAVCNK